MSHAWECPFAGLIEAIAGLPSEAFAWCDVITINQHHAAKEERAADLRSLGEVIKHAGKVRPLPTLALALTCPPTLWPHDPSLNPAPNPNPAPSPTPGPEQVHLYVEPLQKAKAIERLWVLYELATNFDAYGELSLGFSKRGRAELQSIATGLATEFESDARCREGEGLRAAKALDAGLYHIKSNRAKARVKEDERRIKRFIEAREGGYAAFDKLVVGRVMDVVDATKWALRCKACHSQASLARVLEEALPLFIARKEAFHLLLKHVGEVRPAEQLRRALKEAMTRFAGEAQRELKHSAALRRRNSLQHVAALSVRRLELGSSLLLSMRGQASRLDVTSPAAPQPPSPTARPLGRLFTRRASRKDDASHSSSRSTRGTAGRLVALPPPAVVLPERWLKIWTLLNSDDDDAVRDVARQAFADNPQRILTHADWLASHLEAGEGGGGGGSGGGSGGSGGGGSGGGGGGTAKIEVLRLFATLQARRTPHPHPHPHAALALAPALAPRWSSLPLPPPPPPPTQPPPPPPPRRAPPPLILPRPR